MSKRRTERRERTRGHVRDLAGATVGLEEATRVVGGETKQQPAPKKPAPTSGPYLTITLENTMISS